MPDLFQFNMGVLEMNIGILGAGSIARTMAKTIAKMNQAGNGEPKLYGVASRDLSRAEQFARDFSVEKAFGSYEEMLSDKELELVYIATPHSHHYRHMKLCADYGKHILCEKAFTVTAEQAQTIFAYGKEKGVLITEAIWTRYQPMARIIRQELEQGAIGEPKMLTANLCYEISGKERIIKPELAGGALLDVGIYAINFAEMVFGHAGRIQGSCVKSATGVDMADSITMTWKDGRMAVLNAGANCVSDRCGVIYGTKGFMVVENINNPQGLKIYDDRYQLLKEVLCPPQLTGYEYEVMETMECISRGMGECPSMPHEETVHILQIMDGLREQMGVKFPCEGV